MHIQSAQSKASVISLASRSIHMLFRAQGSSLICKNGHKPTYKAGLPACTQGAVGGVVAGLRVGRKVKRVSCEIPPLKS